MIKLNKYIWVIKPYYNENIKYSNLKAILFIKIKKNFYYLLKKIYKIFSRKEILFKRYYYKY